MIRRLGIVLIFVILLLAACTTQKDDDSGEPFVEPARPNILIENAGVTVGGQVTNICWPQGQGNVRCEPSFERPAPPDTLIVSREDSVSINLGESAAPDELVIVSRDPQGGLVFSQTFRVGEVPQFPVTSLQDGENLLEVTAYYYNLAGSEAVVSSVFSVEVGVAVAIDTTPTAEASPSATETVDETPVVEATATPTIPTATPTIAISPSPTASIEETSEVEVTEMPAILTSTPTTETVISPTETIEAVGVTPSLPVVAESLVPTTETATPTSNSSISVTEAVDATAIVEESETPTDETLEPVISPSATEDSVFTPTFTPSATPTVPPTTVVPSHTFTPSPTVTLSPTVTPSHTFTPSPTPTEPIPTSAVEAFFGEVPPLQLSVAGRDYLPIGYTYCEPGPNNQVVCVSQPTDPTLRVRLFRQTLPMALQIGGDERPNTVKYRIVDATTLSPLARGERPGANVLLLNFTLAPGDYLLSIEVVWPSTSGTYYFRLQVIG